MKLTLMLSALFCFCLPVGAQQVRLIGESLAEDSEGVVVLEPEQPSETLAKTDKKTDTAAGEKKAVQAAVEKKVDAKLSSPAKTAINTAKTKAAATAAKPKPAAAKTAVAVKAAMPVIKPVKVEEFPEKFELQAPASSAAAAAAAKPAAPAPVVKPAAAAAAAKPAAPAPAVKPAAATAPVAAPVVAVKPVIAPAATEAAQARNEGFEVDKKHTIVKGETLWDLSGRYYKDPYKWGKIYNANLGSVAHPDRIYPQGELIIPGITEQVSPLKAEEAPAGEGGVSGLLFESEPAAENPPAGDDEISDVEYTEPAPVAVRQTAPKQSFLSDGLATYEKNQLSEEMPADQKEWSASLKVVPNNWQPDAVIVARVKTGYDSVDEGLALTGDKMQVRLVPGAVMKAGDIIAIYLRGAPAFNKGGERIGFELQPAGTGQVVKVEQRSAVISVMDAASSVRKGMLVKVTMRY